jgi:predicted phage tail protein
MLRDIYFHGALGRAFDCRHLRLEVASPAEAVRALFVLRPGLRQAMRAGDWRVITGSPHIANAIELAAVNMRLGALPLHIVPATRPAGSDSTGKIIAGVVLIGAAIAFAPIASLGFAGALGAGAAFGTGTAFLGLTYGNIALLGASMVFAGVAGLLTQPPQVQAGQQATDLARPEDRPSFLFNGVTNNTQQGGPVPVVMGLHLVGSVVVSASLDAEDIAT